MPISITPLDLEEVTQSKPHDERSDSWVHHPPHRTGPSHSGNKHKKRMPTLFGVSTPLL